MSLDSKGKCAVCKGGQAPTGQDGAGEIIWPDSVFGTEGTDWLRTWLSGGSFWGSFKREQLCTAVVEASGYSAGELGLHLSVL